ncbi:N-acetylmuramoyl-L-alanine amidase [Parapedobacter lycopersici]|uniref:N-acetylmuramoyl-L-alanine amidase n=1 Tax=Parapedobacter lycopersici TaxID=1864939 RepID=UPI00214DA571|nr:peptidoglycan recognition family protein [Parapedobacter lycopersici]
MNILNYRPAPGSGIFFLLLMTSLLSGCSRSTFRIFEKPLDFNAERQALSLAYLKERHGMEKEIPSIEPQVIVLHWTAIPSVEKTFDVFAPSTLPTARASISGASALNVSSQFVVDRDGTIFRLLPDTAFARHVIGLNYCAIGVENIGSSNMPLTRAQVKANEALIRYLKTKYPIAYVIGHHEYQLFRDHPLWKETDPDYLTQKSDPGDKFMRKVRHRIRDLNLQGAPQ